MAMDFMPKKFRYNLPNNQLVTLGNGLPSSPVLEFCLDSYVSETCYSCLIHL